jgi:hypothetical protein
MYLFKTSGQTFHSVIANQKHAFLNAPASWHPGEIVLVSKNRTDCRPGERQIKYLMEIESIRTLRPGESEMYWPGSEGRWRHLVSCRETRRVEPFDLEHALGRSASRYATVQSFSRIFPEHEERLIAYMESRGIAGPAADAATSRLRTYSVPTAAGVRTTIPTDACRP